MNLTVYVLTEYKSHETPVYGVYSSRENAVKSIDSERKSGNTNDFNIELTEIDEFI